MFNNNKKLKFYEDENVMAIEYKWFTPVAFGILFFTIIWNSFLFFWYSMTLVVDAPLAFVLFPIIHVAVGLYLIYLTICQFVNKTNIEIDDNYLTIRHSPFPWWGGNVAIPTDNINQLYVKEEKKNSKNGTTYSYVLRAKLNDKTDKQILSLTGLENADMLEIEEQLERFVGIIDHPVKGEYQSNPAAANVVEPRRQHRNFTNSPLVGFYFAERGTFFNLNEEAVEVLSLTQFDWNDGNSDKFFQLANASTEERLLYFDQNKAFLNVFQEESLNLIDVGQINFQVNDPPKSISLSKKVFLLSDYKKGANFFNHASANTDIEQWIYRSIDERSTIRIIHTNGMIHYYTGSKLEASDFEDILNLNAPPVQDIEYDQPDWKEDDLV